jgi:hypothetical protein
MMSDIKRIALSGLLSEAAFKFALLADKIAAIVKIYEILVPGRAEHADRTPAA